MPTILTQVPRGAWTWTTRRLRDEVGIPVCASNRINTPDDAEALVADGSADLVSMARPFLADPHLVAKAAAGRADEINTCIACNQACLDHTFAAKRASCLVNPRACHETELVVLPVPRTRARAVAVVGGGPAGLAAALTAAERGHRVTLFEADEELGGQFRLAQRIPGKEEFAETLRYYRRRFEVLGVDVRLGTRATVDDLRGFDDVVVATGVVPRTVSFDGATHPKVVSYADVLAGRVTVGRKVAVVGAGGIGVDVSVFLTHTEETVDEWLAHWGVGDPSLHPRRADREEAPHARPRGVAPAAEDLGDRERARQDVGLGAPDRAQGQRRAPGRGRDLRPRRRRRPARHRRRGAARPRRRPRRRVRRPGVGAGPVRRAGGRWPTGPRCTWSAVRTWPPSSTRSARSSRARRSPRPLSQTSAPFPGGSPAMSGRLVVT